MKNMKTKIYFIDPYLEYVIDTMKENPELISVIEQLDNVAIEDEVNDYLESWK